MNNCGNSNNSGTKVKSYKNSDFHEQIGNNKPKDSSKEPEDLISEYNQSENYNLQRGTFVICQRNSSTSDKFFRLKSRTGVESRNDFRMARGSGSVEQRGGRGGSRGRPFKKTLNDRDSNSESTYHHPLRPKFHESMKNHENLKYYEDKRINDDTRISKLLRRLCREDDYDHFMGLCRQLQEGILAPENKKYIRRFLDFFCDNFLDALYSAPGPEAKQQVAKCLARVGYVVIDSDFKKYIEWIFNKYSSERKEDIKYLLMKSFGDTIKLNTDISNLQDSVMMIMSELQSTLENVDRPDLLRATVDCMLTIIEAYPETFTKHFRDTVDILVGWHIDSTQQKPIINYASESLQKLRNFWINDLDFTLTLLGQFIEDMEGYDEEMSMPPPSGRSSPGDDADDSATSGSMLNVHNDAAIANLTPQDARQCICKLASLIGVFNTVTKSVDQHLDPNTNATVQWSFLADCLSTMLKSVVRVLEVVHPDDLTNEAVINHAQLLWKNNMKNCINNGDMEVILKKLERTNVKDENVTEMVKLLNANADGEQDASKEDVELMLKQLFNSLHLDESKRNSYFSIVSLSEEKEELVIVANECAFLLLGYLKSRVTKSHDLLYKFIDLQLERIQVFWDDTIVSTLNFISKVIQEVSANLPLELVHKLLGEQSVLFQLRFRNSPKIQNATLTVYQSLLSLKNIPLLQETYRYVLAEFEITYGIIVKDIENLVTDNPLKNLHYDRKHAEIVVHFLLRALSDIANASNSIIGMWALKPSILEFLAVKLRPYDEELSLSSPLLQYNILYLLYAHCSRYNHFVRSSSLILNPSVTRRIDMFPGTLDVPSVSPTSGHLSIILDLISKTLESNANNQVVQLILNWLQEISTQADQSLGTLIKTDEYQRIIENLLQRGATTDSKISLAVCRNFEVIFNARDAEWSQDMYRRIIDLVVLHLTATDKILRKQYGKLIVKIPINIVIPKLNKKYLISKNQKQHEIHNYSPESLTLAQRLYMRHNNGELQAQHFKTYMSFILQDFNLDESRLFEIFTLCWPSIRSSYAISTPENPPKLAIQLKSQNVTSSTNENATQMFNQGVANSSFLMFWGGLEAALHCVQNKLRTALGKPQETFTTIESALKNLAREISYGGNVNDDKKTQETAKTVIELKDILNEHTRVRLLVEFLEHLERVIHNAAEGCAVALQPLPKPVRTFFHTNRSTCKEWLNRIRLALCVVSLHAGLATNVLRNGQRLVQDLSNVDNTQGIEFERAVLCTAQAMVRLGEAEALQGLYIYTKDKDRKLPWLKAAIEEAAGRYEMAAESYKQILLDHFRHDDSTEGTQSKNENGNAQVIVFCITHLCRCYEAISDWKHLAIWKLEEKKYLQQEKYSFLTKQIYEDINAEQAFCLQKFDEGEEFSLLELSNWGLLDEKSKINWSSSKSLVECSNTLTNVALHIHDDFTKDQSLRDKLAQSQQVVSKTMEEALRNVPSEYLSDAVLLQYAATGLENQLSTKTQSSLRNVFEIFQVDKVHGLDTRMLSKILWWSELFAKLNDDSNSVEVASLRLHVARVARKEGNFGLAKRQITRYFTQEQELFSVRENNTNFEDIVQNMLNHPIKAKWSKNNMRAFKETSKLLYSMEKTEDAVRVCSVTALGIAQSIVSGTQADTDLRETGTKMLLMLCKWLQQQPQHETKIQDNTQLQQLMRFESQHNDGVTAKLFGKTTELIPHCDILIGKFTQMGVQQCPDLPLAWASFAAWCYKCGRKIVDSSHCGQLTDADKVNIRSLLPNDVTEADLAAILSILEQNRSIVEDEGDIDVNDINTSEMIENQLRNIPVLKNSSNLHLALLIEIWRQAQKRIYSYYELSANAYFQYLQLAKKDTNDCITITATLRLLRLIVKHAMELQNVLETGLATTPTAPWKEIIPQLFSRLSHPEAYVRTRVSELLCRIAENSPYLITFPSVVGAVSPTKNYDNYEKEESDNSSDTEFEEEDEVRQNDSKNAKFLDICFSRLTDCLSNSIPDSVNQVKILVKELRRITLLWDELWLATLCQHHSEFTKRFDQLELEVQKVQENTWLSNEEKESIIAEKHHIFVKPIIFVLEDLMAMTMVVEPETPHERSFQEKFGPYIEEVITCLKKPKTPSKPQIAAHSLKQLEIKLAQRVHKKGTHSLHMSEISPTLANMKNTCIAMPGVHPLDNKMVTIRSVDDNVQILPTKTKPKKLIFHGSDGNVYTYLFKGLEDLHLDERIMQFLSICNTMMSKTSDDMKQQVYRARHYSVIPLGPRSGLIQWVDGVTPLFALYKKWQQRDSAMTANKNTNASGNTTTILRPSELFYSKLTPLLKERDLTVENRKEWPLAVLKQVLKELMAETPKDLLAKEIWCNSINSGTWWQATKNYSYSVAVMSIIGYIIGLGDRHLDNVLVDLNTGEVVHIDYNVCFEKGKTLRVPEKVPFRMTPNIVTALGVTGVEGIFRLACEHTLRVMRRGRETLLTLLEAFVYDPLVDWKAGADYSIATYGTCQARARCSGIGRKQLELETTRAMFNVRMREMRAEWLANRDELIKAFPMLRHHLSHWIETTELSQQCQNLLQERRQQLALVKEAMTMGRNHTLYTVIKRYGTYKRAKEAREKAKQALRDKMEECQKHISMHNIALSAIKGPQLTQWLSELNTQAAASSPEEHLVFELVKEFLQNAGQSQMIVQCEQSEAELTQLAQQESMLIRACLDLLSQYSAICSLYPGSLVASQHRSVLYQSWVSQLLTTNTIETCNEVLAQLDQTNSAVQLQQPQSQTQNIVDFSFQMQLILNAANERLKKAYDQMVLERLPENFVCLEQAHVDAKNNIESFVRREKGHSERAIECVVITLLCVINRKLLCLESSSQCAVECLANLTTREGVWYLDEMWLISSFVGELVSIIPQSQQQGVHDDDIAHLFRCLKSTEGIYKSLQDLNYNFHTIILPEAMKTIVTEEPTVMRMVAELDEIIVSAGMPLSVVLSQLEVHLRCTIMEMESPHEIVQTIVRNIRGKFDALLARQTHVKDPNNPHQEETLTPGQMLLMGFNGLFEKVQMETNSLISMLNSIEIPPSWKKVDQIREAKEAQTTSLSNETTRRILEDIFLIKRLLTMQDFFVTCRNIAVAFKGGVALNSGIYDDESITKSVKVFTADFIRGQVFGLTTQTLAITLCFLLQRMGFNIKMEVEQREIGAESKVSIEDMCRRLFETSVQRECFSGFVFTQANGLMEALDTAYRAKLKARLTQQAVEIARASVQRLQLQITAHHWLHEDSFVMMRTNFNPLNPLHRPTFMLELRKNTAALTTLQSRVCEAREQQQNLVASAAQRLKWASGANPALGEVMSAFDNAVLTSCEKLSRQHNLASVVINACSSILHYEALRTRTSESLNSDANFMKLVKHWQEICLLTNSMTVGVTPIEEKLVELLQVNNEALLNVVAIDANWLRQAEKLVSDAIIDAQKKLQERCIGLADAHEILKDQLLRLQNIMAEHHKLMTDVRALLRVMAKQQQAVPGLQDFLAKYRAITENISTLVKELQSDSLTTAKAVMIATDLDIAAINMPPLYERLLSFASPEEGEKVPVNRKKKLKHSTDSEVNSPKKSVKDHTTGKAVQERNVYALNVWRRVRMKLDGRDPNPQRKSTTAEQVDFVIREALNLDNLALLYEGWTPWV